MENNRGSRALMGVYEESAVQKGEGNSDFESSSENNGNGIENANSFMNLYEFITKNNIEVRNREGIKMSDAELYRFCLEYGKSIGEVFEKATAIRSPH